MELDGADLPVACNGIIRAASQVDTLRVLPIEYRGRDGIHSADDDDPFSKVTCKLLDSVVVPTGGI